MKRIGETVKVFFKTHVFLLKVMDTILLPLFATFWTLQIKGIINVGLFELLFPLILLIVLVPIIFLENSIVEMLEREEIKGEQEDVKRWTETKGRKQYMGS